MTHALAYLAGLATGLVLALALAWAWVGHELIRAGSDHGDDGGD